MNGKPPYVFDTNVIVSAFLFHNAKPGRALQTALDRGEVLLSIEVAAELNDVLNPFRGIPIMKPNEFLSWVSA